MNHLLGDIGRTKLRLVWAESLAAFEEPVVLPTPTDLNEGLNLIVEQVERFSRGRKLEGAVLGVSRKLWEGAELASPLTTKLGAPVKIENDAALGALGEAVSGAGQGYKIVVYYTISTGVGGARIVSGKIDPAAYGFEPGQQIIESGRTLEDHISGQAVEKQTGRKPFEITDNEFWQRNAHWLAQGLVNSIVHWSPEVVVLGGSMMKRPGIAVEEVTTALHSLLPSFYPPPKIVPATLGEWPGLHGGLALLRQTYQH